MVGTPASSRSHKDAYDSFDFDRAAGERAAHAIPAAVIAPGVFETPKVAGIPEGVQDAWGARAPFPPRPGKPVEFAALAQHICKKRHGQRQVIRLDGALRMAAK